jgi:AcrR family transcriptional regulator
MRLAQDEEDEAELGAKGRSILEAAAKIFLAHGYEATSMDAVAREAGASKATLYAYFPGKEKLFAAIVRAECRRNFEAIAGEVTGENVRDVLLAFARRHLRITLSPKGLAAFRIVAAEAPRFPELGRAFWEAGPEVFHQQLADRIAEFAGRGELAGAEPRRAAADFLALTRGESHLRATLGVGGAVDDARIEAQAEAAVAVFLRAYAP